MRQRIQGWRLSRLCAPSPWLGTAQEVAAQSINEAEVRITFISPVGVVGGAERVMLGLIARLRDEHTISVVFMADGPLVPLIRELNVKVELLALPSAWHEFGDGRSWISSGLQGALRAPVRTWQLGAYLCRLYSLLKKLEPEILHTNGMKAHLSGALTKPQDARLVWHLHDYIGHRNLGRRLLRVCASRATAAIAVSRSVAEDASTTFPRLRITAVPNFVDVEHFCPGPTEHVSLDHEAGFGSPEGPIVRIGLVATYALWKGHLLFLDALRGVVDRLGSDRVRGYIVGGPIYRTDSSQVSEADLRRRIAELDLKGCVGLVPFKKDPVAAYRSLDVVVHASTQPEPFGLTIAEAMACGRAVVAADAGGVTEIITDGEDGLLYRAGDESELVKCLIRSVGDFELRKQLGVRARSTIQTKFNVERSTGKVLEVYRGALNT